MRVICEVLYVEKYVEEVGNAGFMSFWMNYNCNTLLRPTPNTSPQMMRKPEGIMILTHCYGQPTILSI